MDIISLNEYVFVERGYTSLNELISSLAQLAQLIRSQTAS